MIRYSARAAKALGYLKRQKNDIEIYVEDTANRLMWLSIVKKSLPSSVKLKSLNMLGGRDAVETACLLDQQDDNRKRLYIIDSDFDNLLAKKKKNLKHLYRINFYCVENMVINKSSATAIARNSLVNEEDSDVETKLDYDSLEEAWKRNFKPLFISYAIAHKLDRSLQTVGFPVTSLIKRGGCHTPDKVKISKRITSLRRNVISSSSCEKYRAQRDLITKRSTKLNIHKCVSGKDYLLPLLWLRLKTECNYRGTIDQLKIALAEACSGQPIAPLQTALSKACS